MRRGHYLAKVALRVSLVEYARRLLARGLGATSLAPDPAGLFDLGDSGSSDVARQRHRYVSGAAEAWR